MRAKKLFTTKDTKDTKKGKEPLSFEVPDFLGVLGVLGGE